MVKALTEGSYLVIINKLGYKEQTVTINVSDGETTHLKMELEKAQKRNIGCLHYKKTAFLIL